MNEEVGAQAKKKRLGQPGQVVDVGSVGGSSVGGGVWGGCWSGVGSSVGLGVVVGSVVFWGGWSVGGL
eukprot:12890491-Prorocentrum_lima.AAC.1